MDVDTRAIRCQSDRSIPSYRKTQQSWQLVFNGTENEISFCLEKKKKILVEQWLKILIFLVSNPIVPPRDPYVDIELIL